MLFKKKHEFRPDRSNAGLLSKLYITKRQRLNLLKWALMAAVLVFISVLQDVILSRVRIFGATTDLLCGALLCVCILLDPEQGSLFMLIGATLYQFSGTSPGPYTIALLTCIGIVVAIFRQAFLREGFASTFLCSAAAIMLYELLLFVIGALIGSTNFSRLQFFALSGAYTVIFVPVFYPIFRAIVKIGGESWKD